MRDHKSVPRGGGGGDQGHERRAVPSDGRARGAPNAPELRAGRNHSDRHWARLKSLFVNDDPTRKILAAWAGKGCLRQLFDPVEGGLRPYEIRARLERFYQYAAGANLAELTRLATTIETWWPEVLNSLSCASPTPAPRA